MLVARIRDKIYKANKGFYKSSVLSLKSSEAAELLLSMLLAILAKLLIFRKNRRERRGGEWKLELS